MYVYALSLNDHFVKSNILLNFKFYFDPQKSTAVPWVHPQKSAAVPWVHLTMGFVDTTLYTIFSCFTFLFMAVVNLVFDLMYKGKGRKVSKVQDPILLIPASQLSREIRSRKVRQWNSGTNLRILICKV